MTTKTEYLKKPTVSVAMITYNHENYIAQAIESVLMQKTDFDFEIVIGEDCSTDRTRKIVENYQSVQPHIIRAFLRDGNLGSYHNSLAVLQACRGDYIALLEGDDYWTDSLKLHKQVAFMDSHPECSLCFHPVLWKYQDIPDKSHVHFPPGRRALYTLEDVLASKYLWIQTSTVVIRNDEKHMFPSWFIKMPMGDLPFIIMNAQKGDIGYIDEVMGCYRIHSGGTWSNSNEQHDIERMIAARDILIQNMDSKFRKILLKTRYLLYLDLLRYCLISGDHKHAKTIAIAGLRGYFLSDEKNIGGFLRLLLYIHAPRLYAFLTNSRSSRKD